MSSPNFQRKDKTEKVSQFIITPIRFYSGGKCGKIMELEYQKVFFFGLVVQNSVKLHPEYLDDGILFNIAVDLLLFTIY